MTPSTHPHDAGIDRLLGAFVPPPPRADLTERIVAAALAARDLPPPVALRRGIAGRLWRGSPRLAAGMVVAGLMTATAAAATAGMFGDLGVTIPAWQRVVANAGLPTHALVREAKAARAEARPSEAPTPAAADPEAQLKAVFADGKIGDRAELETSFAAADARRERQRATVRQRVEARVDEVLADRRARGLPVPDEARLAERRAQIEAAVARRDAIVAQRREAERDALRREVDAGGTISVEELHQRRAEASAERRRRILEPMSREQRAAQREQWRARRIERRERMGQMPVAADPTVETAPAAVPEPGE